MKTVEFEVCSNNEWLCQHFDCEDESAHYLADAESRKFDQVCVGTGIKAVFAAPGGQRILYHGWNGAQFNYRNGIFGTFDELTPEEIKFLDTY